MNIFTLFHDKHGQVRCTGIGSGIHAGCKSIHATISGSQELSGAWMDDARRLVFKGHIGNRREVIWLARTCINPDCKAVIVFFSEKSG